MHASETLRAGPDSAFRTWLQRFPKTETHLHLEGAIPYGLLHAWRPEEFPADPVFQRPEHRFASFADFDRVLLRHALAWLTSVDRYHEAARAIFAARFAESVRYVETSFHLAMCEVLGVPGREIIEAIRSAAPAGMEVRVFAGMLRTDYGGRLRAIIDDLENWDELAGVDLHGDEAVPTQAWTAPVWRRLREAGKVTKAHAGEFDGAARVREAIEVLGVTGWSTASGRSKIPPWWRWPATAGSPSTSVRSAICGSALCATGGSTRSRRSCGPECAAR